MQIHSGLLLHCTSEQHAQGRLQSFFDLATLATAQVQTGCPEYPEGEQPKKRDQNDGEYPGKRCAGLPPLQDYGGNQNGDDCQV